MLDIFSCNVADGNQTFQTQDTSKCPDILYQYLNALWTVQHRCRIVL